MSTTQQQFDASTLGRFGDEQTAQVTPESTIAYAQATNDPIAQHLDGTLAPPVYAVVPTLTQVAGPAIMAAVPPEVMMRVVHGEQDFHFHRPIEPGMTLSSKAAVVGIHPRSSGVVVVARIESSADGEPVVDQYMTSFFRGATNASAHGEEPPAHAFPEALREQQPVAEVAQTFDADQTYRYAEASGDQMPIHLDDDFAKQMGLPGIIIHGLCTLAFTSQVVIEHACPDDPTRLKRLAVRFAKVVRPQQTITTRLYDAGAGVLHFETTSDSGDVVLKDGLAEVAN